MEGRAFEIAIVHLGFRPVAGTQERFVQAIETAAMAVDNVPDRRLVPQPARIISRFKAEFENLLYLGLMLPLEGRPNIQTAQKLVEKK